MWATKDTYCTREEQDALVARIRGAQLTVYDGAGHGLHWEDPKRFANDLATFVAKLPGKN
jgi:pimeloyl-ACP methyl ester carboxylesterase